MKTKNADMKKMLTPHARKGLMFTLDALFAIAIASGVFMAVFFYLGQLDAGLYGEEYLVKIAMDSLTVLEKDDTLKKAVDTGNATELELFLNSTESSICANITLYDTSNAMQVFAFKDTCNTTLAPSIARRTFIANMHHVFTAKMEIWYNEG